MQRVCTFCNLASRFRCGKCKDSRYCSKECQSKDWKNHKNNCKEAPKTIKYDLSDNGSYIDYYTAVLDSKHRSRPK